MSNKLKASQPTKKIPLPMKELFQQNQLIKELTRLLSARSEDTTVLKSISDKKTGRLRLQSSFAEKSIQDIESKEDFRLPREDFILTQLYSAKVEAPLHRSQFEKNIKKIFKVITQHDEDPSAKEMSQTDIQVHRIMSVKIGPENTVISSNEKGQQCVSVPSGEVPWSSWKDAFCKTNRIIESILLGEVVYIYPAVYCCVKLSRNNIQQEISKQRLAVEEGANSLIPNFGVIMASKKSAGSLNPSNCSLGVKKSVLVEPDFKAPVFNMFLELNLDTQRKIKEFLQAAKQREGIERNSRNIDKVEKAIRLKNYLDSSAFLMGQERSENLKKKVGASLIEKSQILFDLENGYFSERQSLGERIKVVHSCVIIQKWFRNYRTKKLNEKALMIQKVFRGFYIRKKMFLKRIERFKKSFHIARLKHWYPLLVNKFRERKGDYNCMDYSLFLEDIIKIQKNARGMLDRKLRVKWKKEVLKLRKMKESERLYNIKNRLWKISFGIESSALEFSGSVRLEINDFVNSNPIKKDDKVLVEYTRAKERGELEIMKQYLSSCKKNRIVFLIDRNL